MTEKVATGVLSGVVKVSGFITGSVANSKAGKKLFGLLPGEIVLASLDGFSKYITWFWFPKLSIPCLVAYKNFLTRKLLAFFYLTNIYYHSF